jgi:hypothetical protein
VDDPELPLQAARAPAASTINPSEPRDLEIDVKRASAAD